MDSLALATLAALAGTLVGEDGETVESIKTERDKEEAARKELLTNLRERVRTAFRIITSSRDQLEMLETRQEICDRMQEFYAEERTDALNAILASLEQSNDPEAIVVELENEVTKMRETLQQARLWHHQRASTQKQ